MGWTRRRIARIGVGLDGGFSKFPRIDPHLVGDVTGNGRLSGLDAQRVASKTAGLLVEEIPDLPAGPLRLSEVQPSPGRETRGAGRLPATQAEDPLNATNAIPTGVFHTDSAPPARLTAGAANPRSHGRSGPHEHDLLPLGRDPG